MYIHIYIYIYVYIPGTLSPLRRGGARDGGAGKRGAPRLCTANLRTKILYFGGFDSGSILSLGGGIQRPLEDPQECLSQAILVWIILVGRLGVGLLEIPVSVKKTLLFCELLPCSPAAETALQPLLWCFSS